MVYESGFTTRRTYSSRPVTTSYAVSYPSVQKVTRVYKSSYPIYSSYSIPRRIVTGTRLVTSPIRVVTSPSRVVSRIIHSPSPVRVVRTTTRVISSPERTTYSYTTPTTYYSPALLSSYTSKYIPTTYTTYTPSYHYNPTTITRVYARSVSPVRITSSSVRPVPSYLKRLPPGYGARALTNYLNTEPFTTFSEETSRIRNRAQSLIRDLHTPVVRRARSCTPFPVTGYTYEPTSQMALDAYVARVTNPVRHIAKEVHNISHYPRPAVKYVDADLDPNRPSRKFSAPRPLEDPVDLESKEKQRLRQERLLTVNEEALDEVEVEKKRAQNASEEKILREEKKRLAAEAEKRNIKAKMEADARLVREAEEAAQKAAEEAAQKAAEEAAQKAAEAAAQKAAEEAAQKAAEEAAQKAAEEAAQKAEEEAAQKAAEEAAQKAEEEAAQRAAEEAAQKAAEEAAQKAAEEAAQKAEEEAAQKAADEAAQRAAEEEEARIAEDERLAKEALLEEEQRSREHELNRLAEIEKQAEEESEGDLARQAAELAEIGRQEAEIAALELQAIQKVEGETNEPLIEEPTTPNDATIELSATFDDTVGPAGGDSYDDEYDEDE
ncbi:uncharacterized protein CG45076 isoform X1 [Drosophila miranda]|uniref:uncharacterized protein CG45076 isoform X1 n=1 Tax=Drosophila miranda TaxID=7229 RepID=UPI00143F7C0A|nr:uncharacterized protein CG45076 isoform X1 [Drosophila miranda]